MPRGEFSWIEVVVLWTITIVLFILVYYYQWRNGSKK